MSELDDQSNLQTSQRVVPLNLEIFEQTVAQETERLGQAINNELNAKLKTLETLFMKISEDFNILSKNDPDKVIGPEIDSETHMIYTKNGDITTPSPSPINNDSKESYNLYGLPEFSPAQ
jgi:hypothetical protein